MSASDGADFEKDVRAESMLPFEQLILHRDLSALGAREIGRGVVFLYVPWSVVSRIALRRLTSLLSSMRVPGLQLHVIESDGVWAMANLGIQVHGSGETAWVRNGKVCFTVANLSEMTERNVRD